ncbi:putative quinol monooxygenase [Rhizobium halophilum]|uniref:putative quinol monooxygenase n=1 Tax=Rhizobium halophilum TaxID=2846852 RepID=UPI001EFDEC22|nr:antibiotic biosynthesis monooxygenase [Rhizobium halophilum]MCF6370814.1 antibiotic biosynthesis monooxygenase [Rhizobium halophilum]
MIIIAGYSTANSLNERDAIVAAFSGFVEKARKAEGCLDFVISADSVDEARINVFECWRDQQSLDAWQGRQGAEVRASIRRCEALPNAVGGTAYLTIADFSGHRVARQVAQRRPAARGQVVGMTETIMSLLDVCVCSCSRNRFSRAYNCCSGGSCSLIDLIVFETVLVAVYSLAPSAYVVLAARARNFIGSSTVYSVNRATGAVMAGAAGLVVIR